MRNHGTIDDNLTMTIRQEVFARTTNQRSNDSTGLDDWALRGTTDNDTITMSMQGREK
jgi:hypothetical protein